MKHHRHSNMESPRLSGTSTYVSNQIYDEFVAKLMELPIRKRKNFKDRLVDKKGQSTKVIFKNGQFLNYSLLEHKYIPILAHRHLKSEPLTSTTQLGQLIIDNPDFHDDIVNVHSCATATGNHNPRRNPVRIPAPKSNSNA